MSGFLCGGVISQSQHDKNVAEYGVWADTMSWVMPDEQFKQYEALIVAGNNKEAEKLFEKYAVSQI